MGTFMPDLRLSAGLQAGGNFPPVTEAPEYTGLTLNAGASASFSFSGSMIKDGETRALDREAAILTFQSDTKSIEQSIITAYWTIAANKIQAGDPVKYVLPEEGTGRRIEGSAILANCKHPEEAKLFIDFMTSTDAFQIVRDECNRRPVSTDVPGPEGLPALADMKFFTYDTDEAAAIKRDLVQQFNGLL